ncbi:MAG: DUF2723 domain-containing protein, partial [Verrucomicrobiota bacterium]
EFTPSTHFIWNRLVRLVALFPGSLTLKLNVLSAVFGALSLGMIWLIAARTHFKAQVRRVSDYRLATISASAATLFLGLSPAFWFAATRAHTITFDVFLLLSAGYCLLWFRSSSQSLPLFIFSFIYGIGIVEYPLFILLFPVAAVYLGLLIFIRKRRIKRRYIPGVVCFGLLGLSTYAPAAWLYSQSNTYQWLGFSTDNPMHLHLHLWGHHMIQLFGYIPKTGWIAYMLLALVPLGVAVHASRDRDLFRDDTALNATKFILILSVGVVVFLSPWFFHFRLLNLDFILVPYVCLSLAIGYAAGYFYVLSVAYRAKEGPRRKHPGALILKLIGGLFALLMVSSLPFNFYLIQTHSSRHIRDWARESIRSLGDRDWLVSRGRMGSQLLIAAHELDHP